MELTAKALGIELEIHPINLIAGDHLKPEFVKVGRSVFDLFNLELCLITSHCTNISAVLIDESAAHNSANRRPGRDDCIR